MAESAVMTFLLNKLTPLLEEKVQLLTGIREEVVYIGEELDQMKAFLRVADAAEEGDEKLQIWVKQVRDVVHDTEDILDEYMLRSARHHGDGFYASLLKITSSIRNLKTRLRIASALQGIRSRVHMISEGHRRYSYTPNTKEQGSTSNRWYDPREDALLEEVELVGVEKPRKQLTDWLVSRDLGLKVFPVVGMGGLGKTSLVKEVYNDPVIKNNFTNHVWITVSQSFKVKEILKDVIQQLFSEIKQPIPQDIETMNTQRLKLEIQAFLLHRKYVLVLDDVWSVDAWKTIKVALPNNNKGSRVMLTTRNSQIASASSLESQSHNSALKPLSQEDSWSLFSKKTFQSCCPPHLEEISRSILRKCEGLPLAIVAISGVLATKDTTGIDEWEMINRSLNAELEDNSELKIMERILSLSYNDLPYYLQSCFLYLSIFPEHHLIERSRLIRLWVAEGFVKAKEGKTTEEVAENYLRQLLDRNLIQVAGTTSDGRVKMCRVHDLLREIIITKSRDQNFAAIAKENTTELPKKVRRLSLHNTLLNVQHTNVSQIRSLLMFEVLESISKSSMPMLFSGGGLRLLTVLDLKAAPLEIFPDAVVKLFHLRYLSLRDTKVKKIPTSIKNLQNLETLDLKRTYVARLPAEILKLQRLRHLLVYRYETESYTAFGSKQGFQAPSEIGRLQYLQKLCFIEADQLDSRTMVSQLGTLNQLRRLGIVKLKREDGIHLCSSIEKLSSLRALSLTSRKEDEIIDLQHLVSPPRFLQRLYLTGRLESLPPWIPSLHSLVRVFLKWSRLPNDPLQSLEELPNLVHLELLQVCDGKTLCFNAKKFQRLKHLSLDQLDALESMTVKKGALPNLEKLIIQRCRLLKKVPSGIEGLTNLKVLELFDMPNELILTIHPDREGKDRWKVSHIPEVYSTYWTDNRWQISTLRRPSEAESSHKPSTYQFGK